MISDIHLAVPSLSEAAAFYTDLLGMAATDEASAFGFPGESARLVLEEAAIGPARPGRHDLYWKIGLTLRDLDHARDWLVGQGWEVTEPRQFQEIGYLCHLSDPAGLQIELLQQGFEGRATDPGPGHPVAGQAVLAHLTLRVTDIGSATRFAEAAGLTLLSIQPVTDYNFTLYFFGPRPERLPDPDLEAVENREWLWRRPHTLLELQHLHAPDVVLRRPDSAEAGFRGFALNDRSFGLADLTALR